MVAGTALLRRFRVGEQPESRLAQSVAEIRIVAAALMLKRKRANLSTMNVRVEIREIQ